MSCPASNRAAIRSGAWILAASEGNAGPVTTASAVASLLPFVTPPATDIGAAVSDLIAIVKQFNRNERVLRDPSPKW